jgi:Hsp33 protein
MRAATVCACLCTLAFCTAWTPQLGMKVSSTQTATRRTAISARRKRQPRMLPLSSSAEDESAEPPPAPMSNKQDHLISALSGNGEVVVKAITARALVQDALIKQDLRPLAADALGRVMICTLLCASGLKDKETLQFTFSGDGPLNGGKLLAQ